MSDLNSFGGEDPQGDQSSLRERLATAGALIVVAALTALDLIDDKAEGAHWAHLITEGAVVFTAVLGAIYFGNRALRHFRIKQRTLTFDALSARADAKRWREEAASLLLGLSHAIDEQFDKWCLTAAEKEVAILLLKGLSHKEIADIRRSSEKTVRQHATAVYGKANLDGRAQLSAYFLEDLLLPPSERALKERK